MLISTVAGTIHRFGMVRPGDRVLVALSGGPDSVALTHALIELGGRPASDNHPFSGTADELGRPVVAAAKAEPFEVILAHLNHQLRRDSSEDEAFCSSMAVRLDIPFVSEGVDVAELARTTRRSVEDAGRLARYRFFKETARRLGCTRIALGHTRDDQAETFLLRLLRGAGTTGLAAIRPVVEGKLIRPLLESSRREILEYLAVRGLPYRVDPTNADPSIPRNRVRNEALPYLESQFNPSLVDTLARNAELLREEDTWMEAEARRALRQVQTKEDPSRARSLSLSIAKLAALHPALQRRVIRKAIDAESSLADGHFYL
ncbi:MAG: tRNA lysidine(34) synthetase TilS, partial [Acidobacteriota bacterium]